MFINILLLFIGVSMCLCGYVLMNVAACGDQKRALDCPRAVGIESCEVVHMQTGCSSARTVSALRLFSILDHQ